MSRVLNTLLQAHPNSAKRWADWELSRSMGVDPENRNADLSGCWDISAEAVAWPWGGRVMGDAADVAGDSRGPIGSIRYEDTIQWTSRSAFPYRIRGFTLDSAGVGVGNAVVQLFRTSDDVLLQETVSIGPSGQYDVGVRDTITEHYLVAYRASPDIMGTTINTLTGS